MSTVTNRTRYTPEDLLTIPDGESYELVDGHLVERKMSVWSSYVAGCIYYSLKQFCDAHGIAWVFPEGTSFQCFPDAPAKVRKPDTAAILLNRMSLEEAQEQGHSLVRPDLAVEVISPNDLAYEINTKVREFLEAGVPLVWEVNPQTREIVIHRQDGSVSKVRQHEEITGEDVLPGYHRPISDFFKTPTATAAQSDS
jgi:Uma2 family endonuclease